MLTLYGKTTNKIRKKNNTMAKKKAKLKIIIATGIICTVLFLLIYLIFIREKTNILVASYIDGQEVYSQKLTSLFYAWFKLKDNEQILYNNIKKTTENY